jgi:hypothetical protein
MSFPYTIDCKSRLISHRPPAPDPGASYVRSDNSTVLAQVFTDPFTVFSPKKFPGVPCTPQFFLGTKSTHPSFAAPTQLSQRLLQQGLKIPGVRRPICLPSSEHGSDCQNSALAFLMEKGLQTVGENDGRRMPRNGFQATVLLATRTKNNRSARLAFLGHALDKQQPMDAQVSQFLLIKPLEVPACLPSRTDSRFFCISMPVSL